MPAILLDHIAIATPSLADAAAVLAGRLGGRPAYGGESRAYRFAQWRFAGGGRIEALEPRGADGFLHRFLAERGVGIHHVTFKVSSLDAVCDRARAAGYAIVGYDASDPEWKEAFLHPKEAMGIVVQLAESAWSSDGAVPPEWMPRARPTDPPPVAMLGLRLSAHSAARAGAQWGALLEGRASTEDGRLVYRWPGSPMRLAVAIDPGAHEGPAESGLDALEFSSAPPPPGGSDG